MAFLYPQLSIPAARRSYEAFLREPRGRLGVRHEHQVYSPLGGTRAPDRHIETLRAAIDVALTDIDIDGRGSKEERARFDNILTGVLLSSMEITPYEASQAGVWRFFCCVVCPDWVTWRFGRDNVGAAEARYLRLTRNVLGRLWWRGFVLASVQSDDRMKLVRGLNEDELVQIMERPTIAGNTALASCLAGSFLECIAGNTQRGILIMSAESGRQTLMRQTTKRLLRRAMVVGTDAMTKAEISILVEEELQAALDSIINPK